MPYEPLSLEEKKRIARMAFDLESVLLASRSQRSERMLARSRALRPGDWVIEGSTLGMLLSDHPRWQEWRSELWDGQVTRFLRVDREWVLHGDDPAHPDDGYWETYYVCENPDGTEYRWTNCSLRAIPLERSLDEEEVAGLSPC